MTLTWIAMIPSMTDHERLNEARREIELLKESLAETMRRNEKQAVLLRAFYLLVRERLAITEADLLDRFRELELDKLSTPPKRCSACGRTINLQFNKCYYCGERYRAKSAFELLDVGVWPEPTGAGDESSAARPKRDSDSGETGITILPGHGASKEPNSR